jgi:ABC-type multidrug transport system ATPase subunit
LLSLLHTLPQTLLISTHDMRLVQELCPHMVILGGSHVVAIGPTEENLNDKALLNAHSLEEP